MPVTVDIPGSENPEFFRKVFSYFEWVDETFSTYKKTSEISKLNNGIMSGSKEVREVLRLAADTYNDTNGYFDIRYQNRIDPSGIVKGWAIHNAAQILSDAGVTDYYVETGGDIEVSGRERHIGIRNPFNVREILKIVTLSNGGIATSGSYERGPHIYNPKTGKPAAEIMSLTVIGPNVYEADRFATAAYAMGEKGIEFVGRIPGLAGYMVRKDKVAVITADFSKYEFH